MTQRKLEITIVSLRVLHEGECVSLRVLHFEATRKRHNACDVCHPVYHDAYDLCDMYKQKSLSVFKITMLKEIFAHFELQFKSKDKKQTLIDKISSTIGQCTCFQINN